MVDRELFETYAKALGGNIDLMREAFASLPKECAKMTAKQLKTYLTQAYFQIVAQHGGYASVAAMEFYEMSRDLAQVPSRYEASAFAPQNEGLLAYDAAAALAVQQDIEKIISKLFQTGTQRVMEYADETLTQNALADPAKPRWALVPDATACGWCRMIASQGFVYKSEDTVSSTRHPSCKCTSVVDFDVKHPSLEGYDPDALYEQYKNARKIAEDGAWEEWSALSKEEQAKYGGKGRGAYDHFLRNRIAAAM